MAEALLDRYAAIVCDLDGVVYAGPAPIEHAVPALTRASQAHVRVVYATNNASRPAGEVAGHLRGFSLEVEDDDVITSSDAGAFLLAQSLGAGSRVLAVGGQGVADALRAAGLSPVEAGEPGGDEPVEAVMQGYGANVRARDLAEVAYAIAGGARWMATNTDLTLPTERGRAPGNGSLVAAVKNAVTSEPEVAGKPMPTMYEMAAQRSGVEPRSVLAIGDRLETDIEGACSGDIDSVLVMTGVHSLVDAAAAPAERRPTFVVADLRALFEPYVESMPAEDADTSRMTWPHARGLLRRTWSEMDAGNLSPAQARARFANLIVLPS